MVCGSGLAQAAWRHRVDPQREGHHQQQAVNPTGLFDQPRRDKKQRVVEQAKAPCDTGLAFIGLDDLGIAQLAGVNVGSKDKTRVALLAVLKRLRRPDVGLDLPRAGLAGRARCGTAFTGIARVFGQLGGRQLVILPALHPHLGRLGCRKALGLQVKELLSDGLLFALRGFLEPGGGALKSRLRIDHEPALGHAIVASLQTLRADVVSHRVPGSPLQRLPDHLGDHAEGSGHASDAPHVLEVGGMVCVLEVGVCAQRPRAGRLREGGQPRLGPCLEDVDVRGMAIPTVAHRRDAPVLRHHPFQHHLLQVRPVVFGVAVSDQQGVLIAVRDILASQRDAGGIEMIAALVDPCWRTDRQRQRLTPRVAAIGRGFIERAAQRTALEVRGLETVMKQEREGFIGKKLGRQRSGPMGKAHAIEHHPGHGFARREDFVCIGHEACVDQVNQP